MKPALIIFVMFFNLSAVQLTNAEEVTAIIEDVNGCKVYNPAPQEEETISWSGNCINGFANGPGILEWYKNGELMERYEGDMESGWAQGNGILISETGMRYEGHWNKSAQSGYGKLSHLDGSSYEGQWLNGKPHGRGTYTHPNGDILSGEWNDGELLKGAGAQRI